VQINRPLAFVLFLFLCSVAAATVPTTQEIEEALTCQCGCGLTVHTCNHLQCGFAIPAKQEIAKQFGEGKSRDEIVASFLTRYGEKVLSAPTTTGFNLAAWIMPFFAVIVGGVLIGLAGLRWSRRAAQAQSTGSPASTTADQYRDRLRKELDAFDN
jgi:cytochrome c-type biogenesis protein CcmH